MKFQKTNNYEEHQSIGNVSENLPMVVVSDTAKDIMRELDKLGIKHKKYYKDNVPLMSGIPMDSVTLNGLELLTDRKHVIAFISNIGVSNIKIKQAEIDGESTMHKGEFLVVTIYGGRTKMSLLELMFALEDGFL